MSSILQQTLRGLCFDTGWCYAVFWKLKRQARTVLTWEDAFYGPKMEDTNLNPSATTMPSFGQQMEDPIGVSVANMSYHVYSVGEGIIGRVAFTNKHQWVFSSSDKGTVAGKRIHETLPNRKANPRTLPEKYPSGWEHQFAAGIKTIAVIAVPQGVVQLGSTRIIAEDLKLIGHVKALFGTLQNVPGAFLSDLVSGVQGRVHTVYPLVVPAPQPPPRDPVLINIASSALARTPSLPANLGLATTGVAVFNSSLGCSGVGRLPTLLPSQQILAHAHSMPLPLVFGFQGSVPHFQHSLLDMPRLESRSQPPFPSVKSSRTWAGPVDMRPVKVGTSLQPGIVKPSSIAAPTSSTGSLKANPPPRTGIISHLSLSSNASSMVIPISTVSPSPQGGHPSFSANCSFTKSISLPIIGSSEYLKAYGRGRPVWRTESPGLISGGHSLVAAELSDINSSVGSPKVVVRTTKENSTCVVGRSWVEDTQSTGFGASIDSRQLVGIRPSEQSPQLVLGRLSAERQHPDSGRHPAKRLKLDSGRCLTESKQLKISRSSVEIRHLDWGSAVTESGQLSSDLVGNQLAGQSILLSSPLPLPAESLQLAVVRPSIEGGQRLDNRFSVQSGQFGGAGIATQPVSERSSVESSQPDDSKLFIAPNVDVFGGHTMHFERSTISTMKQESCASDFLSFNAEGSPLPCEKGSQTFAMERSNISTMKQDSCASDFLSFNAEATPLPCERSSQTFASESSHLTVQMSDLLQLANQFESADCGHPKDLVSGKIDLLESISSSLDFGSADSSIPNLFTSELDDFDDFFAWLTKAENNKSDIFSQPGAFCASTKHDEVLAYRSTQDCGVITKGKEQYAYRSSGTNAAFSQIATRDAECEPILHTLAADQPLSSWFANEASLSCIELANTRSEPHVDQFVNSRIDPEVSFPWSRPIDGVAEVGPHASMHHDIVKIGKKRCQPGEGNRDRQRIQDRIQELRAIVPDGARCSIDILLDKAVEYMNVLQTLSQDFGKPTQSTMLQIHDEGNDSGTGSEVTSLDASWVIDLGAEGRACPILVENLSQPGQMLVEMLCEDHGIFLEIADSLTRLDLTILKGVMEAKSDKIWARFLIEGPQGVHRVQVLWSLMQLLGSNTRR